MTRQLIQDGTGSVLQIDDGMLLGSPGGFGAVFAHPKNPLWCIKLYKTGAIAAKHAAKVTAMIASTPANVTARAASDSVVQLAWPFDTVSEHGLFAGFVMPRLAVQDTWTFDKINHPNLRRRNSVPNHTKYRLLLAYNLARVLEGVHEIGHFAIDLQPKNVYAYQWVPGTSGGRSGYIALIDCDGFSVAGAPGSGVRYHAEGLLTDYALPQAIEPHTKLVHADRLIGYERQQDIWAYAVMTFQLLNEGLWPYDSVPRTHAQATAPANNIERIYGIERVYAFGKYPNADFDPPSTSRHGWFDPALLALFERVFKGANAQPALGEFIKVFERLLADDRKCPDSDEHWKLGALCGECEKPTLAVKRPTTATAGSVSAQTGQSGKGGGIPPPVPSPVPGKPPLPAWAYVGGGCAMAFFFWLLTNGNSSTRQADSAPVAPAQPQKPEGLPIKWKQASSLNPISFLADMYQPDGYWETRPGAMELSQRANAINKTGAQFWRCTYSGPGYDQVEYYWKDKRPQLADPETLKAAALDHPYLKIRAELAQCPEIWDGGATDFDWEQAKVAAVAQRGRAAAETANSTVAAPEEDRETWITTPPPTPAPAASVEPAPSPTAIEPSDPPAVVPPPASVPFPRDPSGATALIASFPGVWQGTYTCGRDRIGMTLTLNSGIGAPVGGRLDFYAVPENPSVPSGSFEVRTRADSTGDKLYVNPGRWLDRPRGYTTLRFVVRADGRDGLKGLMIGGTCRDLQLRRIG